MKIDPRIASKMAEYIYLIRTREYRDKGLHVYKIGKTRQDPDKRLAGYPKESECIVIVQVRDSGSEARLKQRFAEQFERHPDGTEYFVGNPEEMFQIIIQERSFPKFVAIKPESDNFIKQFADPRDCADADEIPVDEIWLDYLAYCEVNTMRVIGKGELRKLMNRHVLHKFGILTSEGSSEGRGFYQRCKYATDSRDDNLIKCIARRSGFASKFAPSPSDLRSLLDPEYLRNLIEIRNSLFSGEVASEIGTGHASVHYLIKNGSDLISVLMNIFRADMFIRDVACIVNGEIHIVSESGLIAHVVAHGLIDRFLGAIHAGKFVPTSIMCRIADSGRCDNKPRISKWYDEFAKYARSEGADPGIQKTFKVELLARAEKWNIQIRDYGGSNFYHMHLVA